MLSRALRSKASGKGNAPLAQLVEQLTLNQWVRGSSPRRCTTNTKVFDLDPELLTERKVLRVSVSNAEGPPVPIPNTEVKLCSAENTCLETDREDRSTLTRKSVILTQRVHLYPFRTQKLSSAVPKILVWRRTGKIGHSRHIAGSDDSLPAKIFLFSSVG